jgi:hypothetical protein
MTVNEEISVPEVSEFVFAVGDGGWARGVGWYKNPVV